MYLGSISTILGKNSHFSHRHVMVLVTKKLAPRPTSNAKLGPGTTVTVVHQNFSWWRDHEKVRVRPPRSVTRAVTVGVCPAQGNSCHVID